MQQVEEARKKAWEAYSHPIYSESRELITLLTHMASLSPQREHLDAIKDRLTKQPHLFRRDLMTAVVNALLITREETNPARQALIEWKHNQDVINQERYSSHLYSQSPESAMKIPEVKPIYSDQSPIVYGYEVLNACFDAALARDPRIIAFGEDVGRLGDVNQAFKGLQKKYGSLRVSDTGVREATIIGQAIGLALRGLRPIAEIQYLDYVLYALQIMSDDLATLHWRTKGGQKAPVIIRTRGHRLEGIWHSGSPMAGILNLVRGIYVLVPRNMTQAAGFYNTLLRADDPAIIIEVLNGYRLRERLPDNIGDFTVPLGSPEVLREGKDITIVTYGACCNIVLDACEMLSRVNIQAEVIDVQTLLPFDINRTIIASLQKTNRIVFVDEDIPGGASAYMFQQVLEDHNGYQWLDSPPRTITAKPHRPAYGSDGDYWSKPNPEQVFEIVYEIMHEMNPQKYPSIF